MGWGAGRKLWTVLDNTSRVLAVELLCATQGAEARLPLKPAPGSAAILASIRGRVPPLTEDRVLADEIELVAQMIERGELDGSGPS
jgi:histidine ammonia-lyase